MPRRGGLRRLRGGAPHPSPRPARGKVTLHAGCFFCFWVLTCCPGCCIVTLVQLPVRFPARFLPALCGVVLRPVGVRLARLAGNCLCPFMSRLSLVALLGFAGALVCSGCRHRLDVYFNAEGLDPASYVPLGEHERPQVVEVLDLQKALQQYQGEGYVLFGSLFFHGSRVSFDELRDLARRKGASLVLMGSARTGSMSRCYVMPVTHSSTTYTSGSVYGPSPFAPPVTFDATSTTTSVSQERFYYEVGVYDHACLFLVKSR